MRGYRRNLILFIGLVALGLAGWVGVETTKRRSPLSVGATADEAWTYVHSPAAWESRFGWFKIKRGSWTGHALDIQCDASYYLCIRTNRLFATRHIVYDLNTNGTIIGIRSKWKFVRPF